MSIHTSPLLLCMGRLSAQSTRVKHMFQCSESDTNAITTPTPFIRLAGLAELNDKNCGISQHISVNMGWSNKIQTFLGSIVWCGDERFTYRIRMCVFFRFSELMLYTTTRGDREAPTS